MNYIVKTCVLKKITLSALALTFKEGSLDEKIHGIGGIYGFNHHLKIIDVTLKYLETTISVLTLTHNSLSLFLGINII